MESNEMPLGYSPEAPTFDSPVEEAPQSPRSRNRSAQKSAQIKVKLLNTDIYDGRYLVGVVGDLSRVYLVPTEQLRYSVAEQAVDESILENADTPYMWDEEIDAVIPTKEQIRFAILRNGLIRKEDQFDRSKASNALYGAFPSRLSGEK